MFTQLKSRVPSRIRQTPSFRAASACSSGLQARGIPLRSLRLDSQPKVPVIASRRRPQVLEGAPSFAHFAKGGLFTTDTPVATLGSSRLGSAGILPALRLLRHYPISSPLLTCSYQKNHCHPERSEGPQPPRLVSQRRSCPPDRSGSFLSLLLPAPKEAHP
jgi:hypothetical protein